MRRTYFISAVFSAAISFLPASGVMLNDFEETSIFDSNANFLSELQAEVLLAQT